MHKEMEKKLIVRKAIEENLSLERKYKSTSQALWCSDIGSCPRKAMLRVLGYEEERKPPVSLKEKFRFGILFEDDTGRILKEKYGNLFQDQLRLENKIWHGNVDFYLELSPPTLIEHKATGSKWWGKYGSPPTESHIAQLILYGQLYEELYDTKPTLILYYRAWNNWAELKLEDLGDRVKITGLMDGETYNDEVFINVSKRRAYLEKYFASRELPPFVETDECYFRGKPSCPFFNRCHKLSEKKPQNVVEWGLF